MCCYIRFRQIRAVFLALWLSLLLRAGDSQSSAEMIEEFSTKSAARKTEAEFIEIRVQIFGRQPVKGAQDKGFRIAYHNMEPAQSAAVWVVQTGSVR
mgnify:CR=1 FL=1